MKNHRLLTLFGLILCSAVSVTAQQTETVAEIEAKHAAYFSCINKMEKESRQAVRNCAEYLKKYPNDDRRLTEFAANFVKNFTIADEKINAYLKSVPADAFAENDGEWAIYRPDLDRVIPIVTEKNDQYKVEIARRFASPAEEKLLKKAEAVYHAPEIVAKEMFQYWKYFAQKDIEMPNGEPHWWSGFDDTTLATDVVTTAAVLYYYNRVQALRAASGKVKENGFKFISSDFKYDAAIEKKAKYERAGKTFSDVYVADLTLTWGQRCGDLCGSGFTRNKIVVISGAGEILGIFLDAETNRIYWES